MKNLALLGLDHLRALINQCDSLLLTILGIRYKLTDIVAQIKQETGLPTYDPKREKEHLNELAEEGKIQHGLPQGTTIGVFYTVMASSRTLQDLHRGIKPSFDPFGKFFCDHCKWRTPGKPGPEGSPGPVCRKCDRPLTPIPTTPSLYL